MMVYQGKKHVSVIMQAHILVNTKQLKIPITSGRFDPTGKKISLRLNISRARLAFLDHGASNRRRCGQNGVIPTPAARLGIQRYPDQTADRVTPAVDRARTRGEQVNRGAVPRGRADPARRHTESARRRIPPGPARRRWRSTAWGLRRRKEEPKRSPEEASVSEGRRNATQPRRAAWRASPL